MLLCCKISSNVCAFSIWTIFMLFISLLNGFCQTTSTTTESSTNNSSEFSDMEEPTVIPAQGNHTGTIIFLHDYGESGIVWKSRMGRIKPPYMKAICPNAKVDRLQKERSWIGFHENYQGLNGIEEACKYIHYLIEQEIKDGIKPERIVIGGVSQGAILAIHAALSFPKRLAGIMSLSTWHPDENVLEKTLQKVNKDIPILQAHMEFDYCLTKNSSRNTAQFLRNKISNNVIYKKYGPETKDLLEEVQDMEDFCRRHVGPA